MTCWTYTPLALQTAPRGLEAASSFAQRMSAPMQPPSSLQAPSSPDLTCTLRCLLCSMHRAAQCAGWAFCLMTSCRCDKGRAAPRYDRTVQKRSDRPCRLSSFRIPSPLPSQPCTALSSRVCNLFHAVDCVTFHWRIPCKTLCNFSLLAHDGSTNDTFKPYSLSRRGRLALLQQLHQQRPPHIQPHQRGCQQRLGEGVGGGGEHCSHHR